MSDMPRVLTPEQQADARLICRLLPGIDPYKPDRGPIHWGTGPYWPNKMLEYANEFERAIPILRRMAGFLEATQPNADARPILGEHSSNPREDR